MRPLITLWAVCAIPAAYAQWTDAPARVAEEFKSETGSRLTLSFESRGRYESRSGSLFGRDPDYSVGLIRTRAGLSYKPASWIKISGMMQDARAPWYGSVAPTTTRDTADLHESYIELFGERQNGFGLSAGRRALTYGDGRLIGVPEWAALGRAYDHARVYYRLSRFRLEFLLVSPVKIRAGEFNRPVLGDRVWGTYNTVRNVLGSGLLDFYLLRHDQNRPGGFTGGDRVAGTDQLRINTYGFHYTGSAGTHVRYLLEGALQSGKAGPADHRAGAWISSVTNRWTGAGKPFDLNIEYAYASGTGNPADTAHTGTFDQFYPANHDRFGHQDLFGWRNLHNLRVLQTIGLSKALGLHFMYSDTWLASARDALYNGQGRAIAQSRQGVAGRHVGRNGDTFVTFRRQHWQFGGGYSRFFKGEFVRKATAGRGPTYLYIFHSYSF